MPTRPIHTMLAKAARRRGLHMPATGGRGPFGRLNPYRLDSTELPVTDDLYAPGGAILRAEILLAKSAGAAQSLLVTGGSTAGIQAMLLYAAGPGDSVILPANAHASAVNLCALAGIQAQFAPCHTTWRGRPYTPLEAYQQAMDAHPAAKAVLVLRPDYYGLAMDGESLTRLAQVVHDRGMLLLVDEAHGATLPWREDMGPALRAGADLAVASAHKTLPALTPGAWLHAGPGMDGQKLRRRLRLAQTSSPSFLTLLALDDARAWMDSQGHQALHMLAQALEGFREKATAFGYGNGQDDAPPGFGYDPLRLVLLAPQGGEALAQALAKRSLDVEMWDDACIVGIPPLRGYGKALGRLGKALASRGTALPTANTAPPPDSPLQAEKAPPIPAGGPRVLSLTEATFAPVEAVPLSMAEGRVSACSVGLYPPGVAVLVPGQRILGPMAAYLQATSPARLFGLAGAGQILCVIEEKKSEQPAL